MHTDSTDSVLPSSQQTHTQTQSLRPLSPLPKTGGGDLTMTDHATPSDETLELISNHADIPTIEPTATILKYHETIFVIHEPGEVTCIGMTDRLHSENAPSVIQITSTWPEITPADDVFVTGRVAQIVHGPGRETRVLT